MTDTGDNTAEETTDLQNAWCIRPCEAYKDEYDDCKSLKSRFHQYFVFGESIDCQQWLQDYNNCLKYENSNGNDVTAGKAIIDSETKRRHERFKAHYDNNIWMKRSSPPRDWSKPLPEWLQKRSQSSYLYFRQRELENAKESKTNSTNDTSSCTIM